MSIEVFIKELPEQNAVEVYVRKKEPDGFYFGKMGSIVWTKHEKPREVPEAAFHLVGNDLDFLDGMASALEKLSKFKRQDADETNAVKDHLTTSKDVSEWLMKQVEFLIRSDRIE